MRLVTQHMLKMPVDFVTINESTPNNSKLHVSKFTPPESPKLKAGLASFVSDNNDETLTLIGTTKFEPRNDIKNILVTGGAGFMFVFDTSQTVYEAC